MILIKLKERLMAELIKSLRWDHAKKSLHIFAHILLFGWIVSLVMHTKEMNNNALILQYIGVAIYFFGLSKVNQSIIKE